jgi:HTH-type transcriptional regulator/antitoxin HigA
LGVPARFWNALEANHQARAAELRLREVSSDEEEWMRRVPSAELAKRGLIQPTKDRAALRDRLLSFFGVASVASFEAVWLGQDVAYRRSRVFEADPLATAAWLRIGEIEASGVETASFDQARFRDALTGIRGLMIQRSERFEPEMRRLCAEGGVALVIVEEIKGCHANGATRWLSPTKALIQLSLRGRWEDVFWFSFFHEAGHVLLHGKRDVFVDDGRGGGDDEDEADQFASRLLIPEQEEKSLLRIRTLSEARAFAKSLGVPPAIVIGRLQREKLLPYRVGNKDRRRFAMAG